MNTNFDVKYVSRKELYENHANSILKENGKDFQEIK
jgi:hypothetical protein